jgi:hypothetical protein
MDVYLVRETELKEVETCMRKKLPEKTTETIGKQRENMGDLCVCTCWIGGVRFFFF